MGNCQAIDAATLVVQHPCGKVDKFYWPVSASEIMRMNPGHYVALLISTNLYHHSNTHSNNEKCPPHNTTTAAAATNNNNLNPVRITRIKLLRPTDTLVLGQVYRLITTQEVMKGLSAKKHAKMKKTLQDQLTDKPNEKAGFIRAETLAGRSDQLDKENNKVNKHERHRPRSTSSNNSAARLKTWQPSLQSISEAAS